MHLPSRLLTLVGSLAVLGALVFTGIAGAGPSACAGRNNNNVAKLTECVTLDGVRQHQASLQAIADANGGNRLAGRPGYAASVAYVAEKLRAAGYDVTLDPFPHVFVPPSSLQQTAPASATYANLVATGTGYGTVSAPVTAVDIQLGIGNTNTSGCEAADFAVFPAGNIALLQRGTCTFAVKALNAAAAGAVGAILFNQGNTTAPDRNDLFGATLGGPNIVSIPVVSVSYADGVTLSQPGTAATVTVDPPQNITLHNVLAETPDGDPNNVVMAGAHLDSVSAGPGINDNGSGSAALLETALQMAKVKPRNKVRFAWWGAEEAGLVGSTDYVNTLSQADLDRIALYLNFDMVGSPNHVFFVYDGDDSDAVGAGPGPAGSAQIEKTFEAFYSSRGIPFKGTDFTGRSDYGAFIANGVPAGGLFTGAEGIKTAAEAVLWGGTAGQQYDPCYHQACDTFANVNLVALDVNADAIATATLTYAMSTELINGKKSKGNFKPTPENPPTPS